MRSVVLSITSTGSVVIGDPGKAFKPMIFWRNPSMIAARRALFVPPVRVCRDEIGSDVRGAALLLSDYRTIEMYRDHGPTSSMC